MPCDSVMVHSQAQSVIVVGIKMFYNKFVGEQIFVPSKTHTYILDFLYSGPDCRFITTLCLTVSLYILGAFVQLYTVCV